MHQHKEDHFKDIASEYDSVQRRLDTARAIYGAMLGVFGGQTQLRGKSLLDFGTGTGLLAINFQPWVESIDGVDNSPAMLKEFRAKLEREKIQNIRMWELNAEKDALPNRQYDYIVSSMTLHHVKDAAGMIRKLANHLKPGGQMAIADLYREDGDFHSDNEGIHHFGFDPEQVSRWFQDAGLSDVAFREAHKVEKETHEGKHKAFPLMLVSGKKPPEVFQFPNTELSRKLDAILTNKKNRDEKLLAICQIFKDTVPHHNWVGFYLANPNKERELILGPYVGAHTDHTRIPFGKGICGQSAETKKTFVVQDVSKESNYLSCNIHVKSEIVLPILKNGNFVAQLDIDSHKISPFTAEERKFLEELCEKLAELF